jgi:hypothetical protein
VSLSLLFPSSCPPLLRVVSFFLVFALLWFHSDSPVVVFLGCSGLHAVALLALVTISKTESKLQRVDDFGAGDDDF